MLIDIGLSSALALSNTSGSHVTSLLGYKHELIKFDLVSPK